MSNLLRQSLHSPRAMSRAMDHVEVTPGLMTPPRAGDLVWYFDEAGKKFPANVLACHPSGEEAMVEFWELGKLGEKTGKQMHETLAPITRLARRDKYSIPPSPKPRAKVDRSSTRVHRLESKDSVGTIGSALDVREFSPNDVATLPHGSSSDYGGNVHRVLTKEMSDLNLGEEHVSGDDED